MNEQHHENNTGSPIEPNQNEPKTSETPSRSGPQIYVASLSDYNNGILHGRWIEATEDPEAAQDQIDEMLAESPTTKKYGDVAEEWAIHDYEGFGNIRVGENEALSTISLWARGIHSHGLAFSAWVAHVGETNDETIQQFEDCYQGAWESTDAYAENFLDQLGAEQTINETPNWLQPYLNLDVAGFARDLEINGDIITADTPDGGVWVWSEW